MHFDDLDRAEISFDLSDEDIATIQGGTAKPVPFKFPIRICILPRYCDPFPIRIMAYPIDHLKDVVTH